MDTLSKTLKVHLNKDGQLVLTAEVSLALIEWIEHTEAALMLHKAMMIKMYGLMESDD